MKIYITPQQMLLPSPGSLLNTAQLKRRLGEHKMSQECTLGNKSSVKASPLQSEESTSKGSSAKRAFGKMRAPADAGGCPQSSTFYYSNMFCGRSPWLIPNYKF